MTGKGEVYLHFEVALIIGDTVGQDAICCHYQSYTNKIERPIRSCDTSRDNLNVTTGVCNEVNMDEIFDCIENCMSKIIRRRKVSKYRQKAKDLSQNLVISAFREVSFGGDKTGVFGATPFEVLHCLLLGLMKYTLTGIFNYQVVENVYCHDGTEKKLQEKHLTAASLKKG